MLTIAIKLTIYCSMDAATMQIQGLNRFPINRNLRFVNNFDSPSGKKGFKVQNKRMNASPTPISKVSPLVHLTAGALSGLSACVILQPLDLIKTRLQLLPSDSSIRCIIQSTLSNEGILGLWRGTMATILRNVPGYGLYFVSLNEIRTRLKDLVDRDTLNLSSGMAARIGVGYILMPVTVVKVRFEVFKY
jgi:hypothetical protein